ENYLYAYDPDFVFRGRLVLPTGYTRLGIQTAAYANGEWWFGCYGTPKILLRTDDSFKLSGKWEFDAALGIEPIGNDRFLIGQNKRTPDVGYNGWVVTARKDADKGLVFE